MMNGPRLGRSALFTQDLTVWRAKVRANTLSYCTSRTAKRNITSSELLMVSACVCVCGRAGCSENAGNFPAFSRVITTLAGMTMQDELCTHKTYKKVE